MTDTSIDRIKDDLRYWASLTIDRYGRGYPNKVSFADERVQASTSNDVYIAPELPEKIQELEIHINSLIPDHVKIILYEYKDSRPQKSKFEDLGMKTREEFSRELKVVHKILAYRMYGNCVTN